ncbi:MAG: hemerythrin domain-containing protein [Comamonadaceae bacterium]|nr:hemerythrin domain-containing protein [Burkholderiales bacterium]MEB2349725.1 hemerythrin domain-containing protein [Comamonadaceae bacterium]
MADELCDAARWFAREHGRLDAGLAVHLMDVIGGEWASAARRLARWRAQLAAHIRVEEDLLLPALPPGARWDARVYVLEHERIALLADEYGERFAQVLGNPPATETARRRAALGLIDGAHALRHVLEHHHQREESALAVELAPQLVQRVWRAHGMAQEGGDHD